MTGIYKITSPNGMIYIGQSINIMERFKTYRRMHLKGQVKLLNSFKKYGVNKHVFEILEICSIDELDNKEIHYSQIFDSVNPLKGLNIRPCGRGKGPLPDSVKQKISQSNKGKIVSTETRDKIRKTLMGNTPWNKGKKGFQQAWNKGIRINENTRKKLSNLYKGKIGSESLSAKKIIQMDLKNNFIAEFNGAREIERIFGFKCAVINRASRGERITAYDFKWKYKI